ncbi:hypothetical protein QYE76_061422 [Lolium multiflorum]|nr:hypothetical protein QYE76_061422 [Lolium multiflorum]
MKETAALLKSTDATLARIARRQACWEPAEPVVQDGMERRRDSFAQNMEAAAQALARISSVLEGRVPEATDPPPPSVVSVNRAVAAAALRAEEVLAYATPTRYSTVCSAINVGSNHVAVVSPTSGMAHIPASTDAWNNTVQGPVATTNHHCIDLTPRSSPAATGCDMGLLGFRCRCEGTFCSVHRFSDKHECGFDYKSAGREEIAKHNPMVVADKIARRI